MNHSRRSFLFSPALLAAQTNRPIIDTHIHLFAADRKAFPLHKNAPYDPKPQPLEAYNEFVKASGLAGAVIVHPEPYQDDHSYLEYCLKNEPKPGFFRGTALFDPLNPKTPENLKALSERWPGRIKALRIHRYGDPVQAPAVMGAIRDRDLNSDAVRQTVRSLAGMGLMLQMHAIPAFAPQIAQLAIEATGTTVIVDHLCRAGMGTDEQFEAVLRLARRPNVVMKISGLSYSSNEAWPHLDVKQKYLRPLYQEFGAARLIWGGVGMDASAYSKSRQQFDALFDFVSEPSKDLIRGQNAQRLFGWSA